MQNFKFFPLLLALLALSGCTDATSDGGRVVPTYVALNRPSKDAVILSRDINFKNNKNISYCEILPSVKLSYSGFRDEELYPLASLSKVVTTAWALKKLGPDFTFETEWFAKPVSGSPGFFDVHLKTNYDPVFNIEKVLYFISELRQQGIQKIRTLAIDETTRVYLSPLALPHMELPNIPVSSTESIDNLSLAMNSANWSTQTNRSREKLKNWSLINNRTFLLPDSFIVEKIEFQRSADIQKQNYSRHFHFRSAKLVKYLKNLNVYSNNYVTDALFAYLGGREEFLKFQSRELKLSPEQLLFFTGSGLPSASGSFRQDNLGSCFGFLNILSYIDKLSETHGLNLGHILYNPTRDLDGTFQSKLDFSDQIVLKTGRLFENPALNLAGVIATEKGSLYFTFLGHGFTASEADFIESARDQILSTTLKYFPTQKYFQTLQDYQILL